MKRVLTMGTVHAKVSPVRGPQRPVVSLSMTSCSSRCRSSWRHNSMFWSEHLEKDGQNSAPTGGFLFYFDDTVARITANERRLVQMYIQLLSVCLLLHFQDGIMFLS